MFCINGRLHFRHTLHVIRVNLLLFQHWLSNWTMSCGCKGICEVVRHHVNNDHNHTTLLWQDVKLFNSLMVSFSHWSWLCSHCAYCTFSNAICISWLSWTVYTDARNNDIQTALWYCCFFVLCIVIAYAPDQNLFQYVLYTDNKVGLEFCVWGLKATEMIYPSWQACISACL